MEASDSYDGFLQMLRIQDLQEKVDALDIDNSNLSTPPSKKLARLHNGR